MVGYPFVKSKPTTMNTKAFITFVLASALALPSLYAQWGGKKVVGNGNITTQTVTTSDYDEIKLVGSMDVELVSGTEGAIKVTTDDNLHDYVEISTEGSDLIIKTKKNYNLKSKKGILVTVPFRDISSIKMVGSGDIDSKDLIKGSTLEVKLTGSGDINLELDVTSVDATVTGSGDVRLSGRTESLAVTVTGSGDFRGNDLDSNNTDVTVSGSGDAKVIAKQSIKARVSGSGDIVYTGNPERRDTKTSGSGDITTY